MARTSEEYELFGFVSFGEESGGPTDFDAQIDYTSELAEANPDWKLDLNDDVIGQWRGEQGKTADMTLVWGVPLIPGGAIVTAELANLAVDQCELVDERFTLIAPDNYRSDFLEVKLWSKSGDELASESLYVEDDEDGRRRRRRRRRVARVFRHRGGERRRQPQPHLVVGQREVACRHVRLRPCSRAAGRRLEQIS